MKKKYSVKMKLLARSTSAVSSTEVDQRATENNGGPSKRASRQTVWRHRKLLESGCKAELDRYDSTIIIVQPKNEEPGMSASETCDGIADASVDAAPKYATSHVASRNRDEQPISKRRRVVEPVEVSPAEVPTFDVQDCSSPAHLPDDAGNAVVSDAEVVRDYQTIATTAEDDYEVLSRFGDDSRNLDWPRESSVSTLPGSSSDDESVISKSENSPPTSPEHPRSPESLSPPPGMRDRCADEYVGYGNKANQIRDYILSDGDTVMFKDANLKVSQVVLIILGLCCRFSLSHKARRAIIEATKLFAGVEFRHWDISDYYLAKIFDAPDGIIQYHFYCEVCCKELVPPSSRNAIKPRESVCNNCLQQYTTSLDSPNHFISIDLKYQVTSLLNLNIINDGLAMNLQKIKTEARSDCDAIRDVYDSILYKRLVSNKKDVDSELLTYTFNTDGAPLFNSSKRSFWPISLTINELPLHLRFKYPLLAGLCVVRKEPSPEMMNTYLKTFVKQSNRLGEEGFTVRLRDDDVHFVLKPFACSVDSVARPITQNRIQFNGYYGCSWCYSIGVHKAGCMRFLAEETDPDCRTHEEYLKDAKSAGRKMTALRGAARPRLGAIKKVKSNVRGVKGKAVLAELEDFDMIWGFVRDYLHGDLSGVTTQMWSIWCDRQSPINLTSAQQTEVNERLMNMTPPNEVHRCVRPLKSEKCKWKASEWRSWLLFYAIPCLTGVLDEYALQHFALYVNSMYTLLQTNITQQKLDIVQYDLERFVLLFQVIYGEKFVTFNVHSLRHLVQCVRCAGPLWATSTFPYESMIHNLKQHVHSPKGVYEQMATKTIQMNVLRCVLQETEESEECLRFHESLFGRTVAASYCRTSSGKPGAGSVVLLGTGRPYVSAGDEHDEFGENVNAREIVVYKRCLHFGMMIHCADEYNRQRRANNTMFIAEGGRIVKVLQILRYRERCFAKVSYYNSRPVVLGKNTHDREGMSEEYVINDVVVKHLREVLERRCDTVIPVGHLLEKCVVIRPTSNRLYVSRLPNTFEIQ